MSEEPKSKVNYHIDPSYEPPEPTASDMHSFTNLVDFDYQTEARRVGEWMCKAGAQQMRVTIVSDEWPKSPYPNGVYWEGWIDPRARHLPFGDARPDDGTLSPPLTYTTSG